MDNPFNINDYAVLGGVHTAPSVARYPSITSALLYGIPVAPSGYHHDPFFLLYSNRYRATDVKTLCERPLSWKNIVGIVIDHY